MIICMTAQGADLSAPMDASFGRARYFLFVDDKGELIEAVKNEPSAHGAGVQAAQTVVEHGAGHLITSRVGPNAHRGLAAAGIEIHLCDTGTAAEALDAFRTGRLPAASGPTNPSHQGASS